MITKRKLLDMILDVRAMANFQEKDIEILESRLDRLEKNNLEKAIKSAKKKTTKPVTKRKPGRPRKQA